MYFKLTVSVCGGKSTIRNTVPLSFARLAVLFSIGSSFPSLQAGNRCVSHKTAKTHFTGVCTQGIRPSLKTIELPLASCPVTMRLGHGSGDLFSSLDMFAGAGKKGKE